VSYKSLRACVNDLKKHGRLVEIKEEVDPDLEIAEIHRRVYEAGGPALLFTNVRDTPFPAVSNLYGTNERADFLFRHTLDRVRRVVELKADPSLALKHPLRYWKSAFTALTALPLRKRWFLRKWEMTTITHLPLIKSWPLDGGAFITLPQVLTLPPGVRTIMQSNVGMYRIQLSGNDYLPNKEVGMHYQLHRGIGIHHTLYQQSEEPFRVSIFVGGPPSHALAAIFPLPEGLSELTFAGMMGDRRFRYRWLNGYVISEDADFVITGTIDKSLQKPEGPFGDHLGYYSLQHDFPVMKIDQVLHRRNPIWHFTVVGRPPQEDSGFGYLIHKLVGPMLPTEFPGVKEIHAVDVAGVHPLLLAVGSERYMPFRQRAPEEILTQANHLLGSGQTSLAKYLLIAADDGDPSWSAYNVPAFLRHLLERIDWRRDLHFQTRTTIDTLDYSGSGWNAGSKLVMACCGDPVRKLSGQLPVAPDLPKSITKVQLIDHGVMAFQMNSFTGYPEARTEMVQLIRYLESQDLTEFPLIVLVDDARFTSESFDNFLWVTFTRSNPSHDVYGVGTFTENKHWGCTGPLIIDARVKPHHAPGLEIDRRTRERADRFFRKDGPLGFLNC
jgi:4-hydroxy-3-polyprenylbenzoate decarboxylase